MELQQEDFNTIQYFPRWVEKLAGSKWMTKNEIDDSKLSHCIVKITFTK